MRKFIVLTRGRTGSTAIVDTLTQMDGIRATEAEPFLNYDFPNIEKNYSNIKDYPSVIPFSLWKKHLNKGVYSLEDYLDYIEREALQLGSSAFGFKVLSNNFDEHPGLDNLLLDRKYKVVYLRRNIPNQVISGMLANQRGIYNRKKDEGYCDDRRYVIDIQQFKELVQVEAWAVENDLKQLNDLGFEYIEVSYEDFVDNPDLFFKRVLEFIGVDYKESQESSYSIMIKDLEHSVENFQQVEACIIEMGLQIK